MSNIGIKWTFIIDLVLRIVQEISWSFKMITEKNIGHKLLTNIQLQTVIVESLITSRPHKCGVT